MPSRARARHGRGGGRGAGRPARAPRAGPPWSPRGRRARPRPRLRETQPRIVRRGSRLLQENRGGVPRGRSVRREGVEDRRPHVPIEVRSPRASARRPGARRRTTAPMGESVVSGTGCSDARSIAARTSLPRANAHRRLPSGAIDSVALRRRVERRRGARQEVEHEEAVAPRLVEHLEARVRRRHVVHGGDRRVDVDDLDAPVRLPDGTAERPERDAAAPRRRRSRGAPRRCRRRRRRRLVTIDTFEYAAGSATVVVRLVSGSTSTALVARRAPARATRRPPSVRTNAMSEGMPPTSVRLIVGREVVGRRRRSEGPSCSVMTFVSSDVRSAMRASSVARRIAVVDDEPGGRHLAWRSEPLVSRTVISGRGVASAAWSRSSSVTSCSVSMRSSRRGPPGS